MTLCTFCICFCFVLIVGLQFQVVADPISQAVSDSTKRFPGGYFAICAVTKDEPDLLEWVDYHYLMGTSKFYIYDSSNDPAAAKTALSAHISSGLVTYNWIPGIPSPQFVAYNKCIEHYREQHQFIGFIDVDEFIIVANSSRSIPCVLRSYEQFGGLALSWRVFGTAGHYARPNGGVLINYDVCSPNHHIKSIANTNFVEGVVSPHVLRYTTPYHAVSEDLRRVDSYYVLNAVYKTIYINHYLIKSAEDFAKKLERGNAWGGKRKSWASIEQVEKSPKNRKCEPPIIPKERFASDSC